METPKGTVLPFIDLKGQVYLQVMYRLVWFREEHPDWTIQTNYVFLGDKHAVCRAEVLNSEGRLIATGHKREDAAHFNDFQEKAETGAIGRALALCGYGTQFAPELNEGTRIVDSPAGTRNESATTSHAPGQPPGDFVVPFGRDKGAKIKDLPTHTLQDTVNYWKDRAIKEGKELTGSPREFINAVEKFMDAAL